MALAKKLNVEKTLAWGAKNPQNIFVKNVVGRFGVNFSKNPKFPKMGVSPKFPNAFREKKVGLLGPGPENYCQKIFYVFPARRED